MNTIQKAAFAASALAITLAGSALVTAPMVFARTMPVGAQGACAVAGLQPAPSGHGGCRGIRSGAALLALNHG
jgi:hypothetical protein